VLEFKAMIEEANEKYFQIIESDPLMNIKNEIIESEVETSFKEDPEEQTESLKIQQMYKNHQIRSKINSKSKKDKKKILKPTPKAVIGMETEWKCSYCENFFANKFDMLLHRKRIHQKE
jgi:hypothetical protein